MKTNKNIEQDFDNWSLRVGLIEDEEDYNISDDISDNTYTNIIDDYILEDVINDEDTINRVWVYNQEQLNVNFDVNIEDNNYENFTIYKYPQTEDIIESIDRDELIRRQRSEMFYEECKEIAYDISSYIFRNKNNSHLIEHYISGLLNNKRINNKIGECEFYREANNYNTKIKITSVCGNYFYSFEIPYF